jgi:hypothetical protein
MSWPALRIHKDSLRPAAAPIWSATRIEFAKPNPEPGGGGLVFPLVFSELFDSVSSV